MPEIEMKKILVVDDEPMNVELLEAHLARDYNVITAFSGEEALEKIKNEDPDLILLDIMMPDIDGYEVCRTIKSDPKTQFIPIILVTALFQRDDRIKGIEAGADDFLTKPVDKLELVTRVKSLMQIKILHDILLFERDRLDMQNHIRSILTMMIPLLLQMLPFEQKHIIVSQMTDMVERTIFEKYENELGELSLVNVGGFLCNFMNDLGGKFFIENAETETECIIKGTCCPWDVDEIPINPIMCNITRGIFSRIADRLLDDAEVDVLKTIGNDDDCCLFEITTN
ncbi:MAG: methanogen output domain 1-containing protein [ANME-2 cluster archaeon]|jgi:two-component system cell cycle response regulator|nr:methanogen output domain 1-containing protein [ANME-2 cluster archaeon]